MKKILLSVAGFDSSGGAGVLLDLHVFRSLGYHGVAVLTALTSQNVQRVFRVYPLPASFVLSQYQALQRNFNLSGMKLGLIGHASLFPVIQRLLEEQANIPRVVDPVFRASSGAWFLEKKSVPDYIRMIAGRATIITPNIEEAHLLTGIKIRGVEDMERAARVIRERTGLACLLKGGHLPGPIFDLLLTEKGVRLFPAKRLQREVHGTGCFLSSSLVAYLARGLKLEKACSLALAFTRRHIARSVKPRPGRSMFVFLR